MRILVYTREATPRLVARIEARSVEEAQERVGSLHQCVANPLDMPLATFLRRIPGAKRRAIRAALATDAVLNDAWELMHTYTVVSTDDQNVIDFATLLATNGNITAGEAAALLA